MFTRLQQHRNLIAISHDVVMAALSFVLALYLRLGTAQLPQMLEILPIGLPVFTAICFVVFLSMQQYRGVWRYASMQDLVAIAKSASLAVLIFLPVLFLLTRLEGYPRSTLVINWLLLMALLGGPRLAYRWLRDRKLHLDWQGLRDTRMPVLLVGAADQAELFIRSCQRKDSPQDVAEKGGAGYRVVGILEDHRSHIGRNIHGVEVCGTPMQLPKVVEQLTKKDIRPQKIILTGDALEGAKVRTLVRMAEGLDIPVARLPRLSNLLPSTEMLKLKPIAIEDLLGREQLSLDLESIGAWIKGKRVLVTGAGGTIGSELVRQVAGFAPSSLMMLDISEYGLYSVDKEVEDAHPTLSRMPILANVRDRAYVHMLFDRHKPDIVFHAAAIKHVPLAESNPHEAVLTNIGGTRNVADAARASGALAMVMISTDKAVNPTSLMGATKRAAEYYCQALGDEYPDGTRFMTVRFGNVLGSTGSVVPRFRQQLEAGGPLTVTHAEMVRYFMTVHEAVSLVLQAAAAGGQVHMPADALEAGLANGLIFVLDMGEPVKIMDLAKQMIQLAGLEPGEDIAIDVTGLRPGEKLYEELFYADEAPIPTTYDHILLATPRRLHYAAVNRFVENLERAGLKRDTAKMYGFLHQLVEEYRPSAPASMQPSISSLFGESAGVRQH